MFNECLMLEVHHKGRFNRENGVAYVGGDVTNYLDFNGRDELSFFEVETVIKCYGYSLGDLIYYKIPNKSLDKGLQLLSSDHDILEMVRHHNGHGIVELYVVGFILYDVAVDVPGWEESVDEEYEEEYERNTVYRSDPFWNEVLSDDSDALEINVADHTEYGEAGVSVEGEDVEVDQEFVGEPSHAVEEELEAEVTIALAVSEDEAAEGEGEDEPVSDMSRSDILIIRHNTSEEDEPDSSKRPCVDKRVPFTKFDFEKPTLQLGNTFESVYDFRKAIKQANILKGNDLVYQKNSRSKVIAVCGDKNCKYWVYGR